MLSIAPPFTCRQLSVVVHCTSLCAISRSSRIRDDYHCRARATCSKPGGWTRGWSGGSSDLSTAGGRSLCSAGALLPPAPRDERGAAEARQVGKQPEEQVAPSLHAGQRSSTRCPKCRFPRKVQKGLKGSLSLYFYSLVQGGLGLKYRKSLV